MARSPHRRHPPSLLAPCGPPGGRRQRRRSRCRLAAMVALGSLCVFCGSSTPADPRYPEAARSLGRLAATRGIDLVYGGGSVGLIGVLPAGLFRREVAHPGLTALHEVASMHERKRLMYDLADAFVALPGGLGTLDELAEVASWSQLGLHAKPVVLLDVDDFWEPLVAQLDRMVRVGLLRPESRRLVGRAGSAAEALAALAAAGPASAPPGAGITPGER